jgi:putative nucleotidyltransferase with HDIG domain
VVGERGIDWEAIEKTSWWRALEGCPQDPRHHGEGDVATHTRMVCNELEAGEGFADLPDAERRILRLAALLHDIGKPATTKTEEDGRITSNGHARVGSVMARRILWERGVPQNEREAICGLVRWHMRPGYFLQAEDPTRTALTIAQTTRCDHLTRLAEADTRGRIAPNTDDALVRVGLFGEACQEIGVWETPFPFASDHSRFVYFRTPGRDPHYEAYDDTRGTLTLMSGLPGAGKDTWVRENLSDLPAVSLDALRAELGIHPSDPQEPVAMAALERARVHLRAGQDFVWNATNLRHELRARPIGLAADYGFRVRIVYREATYERLFVQNRNRASAVPEAVMHKYIDRWEMPSLIECHTLI